MIEDITSDTLRHECERQWEFIKILFAKTKDLTQGDSLTVSRDQLKKGRLESKEDIERIIEIFRKGLCYKSKTRKNNVYCLIGIDKKTIKKTYGVIEREYSLRGRAHRIRRAIENQILPTFDEEKRQLVWGEKTIDLPRGYALSICKAIFHRKLGGKIPVDEVEKFDIVDKIIPARTIYQTIFRLNNHFAKEVGLQKVFGMKGSCIYFDIATVFGRNR